MKKNILLDTQEGTNFLTPEEVNPNYNPELAMNYESVNQYPIDMASPMTVIPQRPVSPAQAMAPVAQAPIVQTQPAMPQQGQAAPQLMVNPYAKQSQIEQERPKTKSEQLEQQKDEMISGAVSSMERANQYAQLEAEALRDAITNQERVSLPPDLTDFNKRISSADKARQNAFNLMETKIKKVDQDINDILGQDIDPKRFWNNTSTPMKILGTIGLIFAGLGGPESASRAVSIINGAIERDIEAQKQNLGKRYKKAEHQQNIYKQLLDSYQNTEIADRAMANIMLEKAKLMIESKIKNAQNSNAKAQGFKSLKEMAEKQSKNNMEMQKIFGEEAQNQFQKEIRSTQGEVKRVTSEDLGRMSKEDRQLAIVGFGGLASDAESAKKMRELYANNNTSDQSFERLFELSKGYSGKVPLTEENREINRIVDSLIGNLRVTLTGPGVMSEPDKKIIEGFITNPSKLVSLVTNSPLEIANVRKILARKTKSDAEFYGFTALPLDYENRVNTAIKQEKKLRGE